MNITSSGLGTSVTKTGNVYEITGGTRPADGPNLFHSFGNFSLTAVETARFQNTTPLVATSNILARVTGGNPSSIFGTIDTLSYPAANLFLMNPAGIIFGHEAALSVGGMATFTTADYLRLTDGVMFNAMPNLAADTLLSAAPLTAFGFIGSNPGAITVHGSQLSVAEGQSISLAGGDITIQSGTLGDGTVQPARLSAPNGQVRLASSGSAGEFLNESLLAASDQAFSTSGTIILAPGSDLDVSHSGMGSVSIRGGEFVLNVTNSLLTTADSSGAAAAAVQAAITEDSVSLTGGSLIMSSTTSGADGAAIDIMTGTLEVRGASQIVSSNEGPGGAGGPINITATNSVTISGYDEAATSGVRTDFFIATSGVFAGTLADGQGGLTTITSPKVTVEDSAEVATLAAREGSGQTLTMDVGTLEVKSGGRISSVSGWNYILGDFGDGLGQAGKIHILASDSGSVLVTGTGPFNNYSRIHGTSYSLGGSAPIEVTAPAANVTIENGGRIENIAGFGTDPIGDLTLTIGNLNITNGSLNTIGGEGRSGNIWITATGNISLSGEVIGQPSPIHNESVGSGGTGTIGIEARTLELANRARIMNSTFSEAMPSADTKISIKATESVTMSDKSDIRVISFLSDVGGLEVFAPTITLSGQSSMNTFGLSTGNSGPMTINTRNFFLADGSKVNSSVLSGSSGVGGSITVQGLASPAQSVLIDGADSGIFTTTEGAGAGGNILVDANRVTVRNRSTLSASSAGTGDAGNILINAGNSFAMTNSSVTTEAAQAGGGDIKITTAPTGMVQLTNSTISASVADGPGGGGNISIDPQFVILQNSQILAQAAQGQGGNITIVITNNGLFLPDATSVVNADSGSGVNGTVEIQSPISQAGGKVVPLSNTPVETPALLGQRCAALASAGQYSSFVVAGRDTVPTEPGGWLVSPLAMVDGDRHPSGPSTSLGTEPELVVGSAGSGSQSPLVSIRRLPAAGTAWWLPEGVAGCGS
jgi:filamentous hemagglutinin family protein